MPHKMAASSGSITPPPDAGSNATRLQRNLAEKQRRDKLNGFISELATIVPMVAMASKRLDKTSILRLSAAHLRICQSPLSGKNKRNKRSFNWCPNFLSNEQIREIFDAVDGFLMVTTPSGKIMYISHTVENFLGHQNIEMIGHSIFSFIHPSDYDLVKSEIQNLCVVTNSKKTGNRPSSRCSFYCRMKERSQPRSEVITYQFVHVMGHMAAAVDDKDDDEQQDTKSSSTANYLLKAFVRVVHSNPYNELSLADAIQDEYVTRHALDGTIIFADHRLATITGHLPHEVFGMSAYEYIIKEDIPIALFAHQLMFSNNKGTGLIVYRLRTKDSKHVYLRSTGYLQFERSSAQVDHFVCVNRHLSNSEGDKELKDFIDRFTPHINGSSTSSLYESIKAIRVSGLKIPLKIETKNRSSCSSDTLPILNSPKNDSNSIKMEIQENEGLSKAESKNKQKVSSLSSNMKHSIDTKLQNITETYSRRVQAKLELESSPSEVFVNHSPLTESSLSVNSPQSDDACLFSPNDVMENSLSTAKEKSIAELPNSILKCDNEIVLMESEDTECNLFVPDDGSQDVIYQNNKVSTILASSALITDNGDNSWDMPPGRASFINPAEILNTDSSTLSETVIAPLNGSSDSSFNIC